jgi:hypothetical protein
MALMDIIRKLDEKSFALDWLEKSGNSLKEMGKIYSFFIKKGWDDETITGQALLLGDSFELIQDNYNTLLNVGLTDVKIASQAPLLGKKRGVLRENCRRLRKWGLKDSKIVSQAQLLGRNPETLRMNYQKLKTFGLKDSKIVSQAQLLSRDPEALEQNWRLLKWFGLKDSKIANQAQLLGLRAKTLQRNYINLQELGLKASQIASQAQLMGIKPKTLQRNYGSAVGLLRADYRDRKSGREDILKHAALLGMNSKTVESNVQFLDHYGIKLQNIMLDTKVSKKREKLSWMLREVFDYRKVGEDQKRETIENMYSLVRDCPRVLVKSIKTLEKEKDWLRDRAKKYSLAA